MRHSPTELKKMLIIEFEGESVFDGGGISRSVASCMIHEWRDLTDMLTENSFSYSHTRYLTSSTACSSTLQITTPSRSPRVLIRSTFATSSSSVGLSAWLSGIADSSTYISPPASTK